MSDAALRKILAEVNSAFARADLSKGRQAKDAAALRTMAYLKLGELALECQRAMAAEVRRAKKVKTV